MGLCTIRASADFKRVRGGARWSSPSFVIETKPRLSAVAKANEPRMRAGDPSNPSEVAPVCSRFGFTVTKKLGNAVVRNRIRRRLKEAIRTLDQTLARPGFDYVVVARSGVIEQDFASLRRDMETAFARLNRLTSGRDHRVRSHSQSG